MSVYQLQNILSRKKLRFSIKARLRKERNNFQLSINSAKNPLEKGIKGGEALFVSSNPTKRFG
jgi:hypothetical protein